MQKQWPVMKTSNEAQKWIYVGASLNKPPIFNPTPISVHFVASTPPPGPYPIAACLSKIAHRNSIEIQLQGWHQAINGH
ncbi:hypothetical protein T12_10383 [Trichinella patagoniensis]|uniref:Uncharacterized protein n=1 Tax=Trichinella patagoniensis TaxID=990121 RepID=A0A0V0ZM63_9BILA|nr:hypothetical protein T06_14295 [Trichinella sp. T6]KRY13581.1 hypothetical protein T12_10383 [Trichinella patagoniensis]